MDAGLGPRGQPARDFIHHQDAYIRGIPMQFRWGRYAGHGPVPASILAKRWVDTWPEHGGLLETMGVAMQQLAEDFPETVERIKRLQIPVSRYGGVGHVEPAPVGRMRDLAGMTLEEAIQAQWEFETRTLIPNWHLEGDQLVLGNPRTGQPITLDELPDYNLPRDRRWLYGGTLAIQVLLGITPLDFRQYAVGGEKLEPTVWPTTPVKKALGMGNWPDPSASQWDPANRPLLFYRRTYGLDTFEEVLHMPCPLAYILSLMAEEEKEAQRKTLYALGAIEARVQEGDWRAWEQRTLTQQDLRPLPEHLAPHWLSPARPLPGFLQPRYRRVPRAQVLEIARALAGQAGLLSPVVQADTERLSLCEAFQALVFSLESYAIREELPGEVTIEEVLGPVDYAVGPDESPALPAHLAVLFQAGCGLDSYQRLLGAKGAACQGISRACPEVNPVNVLHAAWLAARQVRKWGHVPGAIPIYLPLGVRAGQGPVDVRTACNAAEFLLAMARELLSIVGEGMAMPVRLDPLPIASEAALAFRGTLDAAWTGRVPLAPRSIPEATLAEAAVYLDARQPRITHDGDYGGPPDWVETNAGTLSLSEAFCGLAAALAHFRALSVLPDAVEISDALGPVDYTMYELEEEPKWDPAKRIGGWQPYELKREYYPDLTVRAAQGFVGTGEWGQFQGQTDIERACDAACRAVRALETGGHVPGAISLALLDEEGTPVETTANAAELLYLMASAYLRLHGGGDRSPISVRPVKIVADERCQSVTVSTPVAFRGGRLASDMTMWDIFTWRAPMSRRLLHRAWTYKPR